MRHLRLTVAGLALAGVALLTACAGGAYDKMGYNTVEKDGRLYVFVAGSSEYQKFQRTGEIGKSVTRVGEGPKGMTVIGPDEKVLNGYLGTPAKK